MCNYQFKSISKAKYIFLIIYLKSWEYFILFEWQEKFTIERVVLINIKFNILIRKLHYTIQPLLLMYEYIYIYIFKQGIVYSWTLYLDANIIKENKMETRKRLLDSNN